MKKVKIISVMMMLSIVLLAMASCGGKTQESEGKPSRDGFNVSTNKEIEFYGLSFSVPDYCDFQENEDSSLQTMLEENRGTIIFQSVDSELSEEEFSSSKVDLLKEWNKQIECETTGDDGSFTTTNDSGLELTGKSDMILNSYVGKIIILVLYQSENAEYDYMSDFDAIVASARKVDSSTKEESKIGDSEETKTEASNAERAETDISPEFKETMDSYEAFFDEYVEFMQKYNENPSDTALLLELSSMMTKEAEMLKQLNEMDESQMTTAEAAYYLEVTARINEKLASVL